MKTLSIPSTITSIGNDVFIDSNKIESFEVDKHNENYHSENGTLYNKNMSTLVQYPIGKIDTIFSIPSTVVTIGNNAFKNSQYLQKIGMNKNIHSIGTSSFEGLTELRTLTIYSNLNYVGKNAFSKMSKLNTFVYLGTSLPECHENVFSENTKMKNVYAHSQYKGSTSFCEYSCKNIVISNGEYDYSMRYIVTNTNEMIIYGEGPKKFVAVQC